MIRKAKRVSGFGHTQDGAVAGVNHTMIFCGIHGGKKNVPDDYGAITFSGTFSGTLVGACSGAGAGVWTGFGTVSGMSIGVEPG